MRDCTPSVLKYKNLESGQMSRFIVLENITSNYRFLYFEMRVGRRDFSAVLVSCRMCIGILAHIALFILLRIYSLIRLVD